MASWWLLSSSFSLKDFLNSSLQNWPVSWLRLILAVTFLTGKQRNRIWRWGCHLCCEILNSLLMIATNIWSILAVSKTGYNKSPPNRKVSHFPLIWFDLICLYKRFDITNPRYIEPISVYLECSIWPVSTVYIKSRKMACQLETIVKYFYYEQ